VITGSALATSLALTRDETWEAILRGRCGMGAMSALETALPAGKDGGQAVDLPADYAPGLPREVRYLRWTIEGALRDAGVAGTALPYAPERCGYMLGTTLHGMRAAGQYLRTGDFGTLKNFLAGHTLRDAVAGLGPTGLAATTCSACSSSLGAIALAVTLLETGELDLVIAGGYDTISEYVYGGFNSLRLVAEGPLRPFARGRQGMKLAEGYGIVVLERDPEARRRGAKTFATVLGHGESADAHHLTQPHPAGEGAARAVRAAIASARIGVEQVDLITAHATGTPDNDAGEFAAFSAVFSDQLPKIPVVAFKSHLGHTLGGAGAVELILSACAMRDATVPACANSRKDDVEFDGLKLSLATEPRPVRTTLNTSLGFGGANTCVVLKAPSGHTPHQPGRADGPRGAAVHQPALVHEPRHPERSEGPRGGNAGQTTTALRNASHAPHTSTRPDGLDVVITGIGIVAPNAVGNDAFITRLNPDAEPVWARDTGSIPEASYIHLLNARRVRRMSDYVKLSLAATTLAVQDGKLTDVPGFADACSVVLGTAHGSANYSAAYYGEIVKQGIVGANPMLFAEGVPNAAAAHLSLMLGLKGACQTIIGTRTAGLDALRLAALRIANGDWARALVGGGEEYDATVNGAYAHCGLYAGQAGSRPFDAERGFVTGAAAVTFVLESRRAADARGARVYGIVASGAGRLGRAEDAAVSAGDVLRALGSPACVLSSANGTWVDRAEAAAIRRACPGAQVGTVYGAFAEHFSASPLLGLAAVLRGGVLPGSYSAVAQGERVAALCTDFTGWVSGVSVTPGARSV
jgi:3-oxoacyl-[acyl-carrier-protein] synthase II